MYLVPSHSLETVARDASYLLPYKGGRRLWRRQNYGQNSLISRAEMHLRIKMIRRVG